MHRDLLTAILDAARRTDLYLSPARPFAGDAPTTPLDSAALGALVTRLLPGILAGIEQARAAYGDRRLSWAEVAALATIALGIVSAAVKDGAPLVKGASAYQLVGLIFGAVFDSVLAPLLPAYARWAAPMIRAGALRGLKGLYDTLIRNRRAAG